MTALPRSRPSRADAAPIAPAPSTYGRAIDEVLKRIAASGDDKVWISRVPDAALRAEAAKLDARRGDIAQLPLYGVPFAVKDNIDVAGLATTAACPRLRLPAAQICRGGATPGRGGRHRRRQGQPRPVHFTGLVGVRSPYGVPRNPFDASFIPGGSRNRARRSPSPRDLVSFSLGTDTAGSGRVPASFRNIVGLKPTPGLLSNGGSVPACRSLDPCQCSPSLHRCRCGAEGFSRAAHDAGGRRGVPFSACSAPRMPISSATRPMRRFTPERSGA